MRARLEIHPFSLKETLECGQFFRYTKVRDAYVVQSSGRVFSLSQEGDSLFYEGVEESHLARFFRLEDDVKSILREIDQDPFIHRAIQKYPGLRLIRQDPWECLLSFLCSSAKAISHIRSMVELLCKASGTRFIHENHVAYTFPQPGSIRSPLQLKPVGAGFRTDFLFTATQRMDRDRLLFLKGLPYPEARKKLMELPGVGRKIADCVLLYSLDFLEAFPIDTWIRKGLEKTYRGGKKIGDKKLEAFVSNHFGAYAGYAQLFLYHFWRNHGF